MMKGACTIVSAFLVSWIPVRAATGTGGTQGHDEASGRNKRDQCADEADAAIGVEAGLVKRPLMQ